MAKSSSSSKSSKSSKSMGIDLTMVLLAVLVGLLVCSLMNNKPLIEGLDDGDPVPDLARQSECTQASGDLMCRPANSNSRSPADAFVAPSYSPTVGGSMAVCNQPGKTELWCHIPSPPAISPPPNTRTGGGPTTGSGPPTMRPLDDNSGKCIGRISRSQDALCGKYTQETPCNNNSGGVCSFKKSNDIYSYSGGLEGSVWYEWMEALNIVDSSGNVRPNILPSGATSVSTDGQPILNFQINQSSSNPTSSRTNNFLEVIDVVNSSTTPENASSQTSNNITNSNKIPKSLKTTVKAYVDDCINGWETDATTKDIYRYNGGKPIMQYSLQEGLKCLNPYYQPVTEPGTIPRLFRGKKGCPAPSSDNTHYVNSDRKGCATFNTPVCDWPASAGYLEQVGQGAYNNLPFTESGACGLPVCAGEYPGSCFKVQTKDTLYDASEYVSSGIHNLFKRT